MPEMVNEKNIHRISVDKYNIFNGDNLRITIIFFSRILYYEMDFSKRGTMAFQFNAVMSHICHEQNN